DGHVEVADQQLRVLTICAVSQPDAHTVEGRKIASPRRQLPSILLWVELREPDGPGIVPPAGLIVEPMDMLHAGERTPVHLFQHSIGACGNRRRGRPALATIRRSAFRLR